MEPLLGNLIESGEAYLVEHAARFETLVHERLTQLAAWRPCPTGAGAGTMDETKQELWCVGLLRQEAGE